MQKGILILLLLCVFSCTVEKRLYRPGYSIEWKHRKETVKNDAVTLRLKEENTPIVASEKEEMEQEQKTDSYSLADTASVQEIRPAERMTPSAERVVVPQKLKRQLLQQNPGMKAVVHDDPEEKREPKYANGFMQFLAVLLGIIVGIIASAFFILFIVIGGEFLSFDSDNDRPENYRTFRSVFAATFRITFLIVTALLIIAALVLLAIILYQAYGLWALIGTIVVIVLLLLLLGFLFGKAFDFVFHER